MAKEKYLRLGELLVKEGLINLTQLEKAVAVQRQEGGPVIICLGMCRISDKDNLAFFIQ